jgi:integrase
MPIHKKTCTTKKAALEWEVKTRKSVTSVLNHGMACGDWIERRYENYLSRKIGSLNEKKRTYKRFLADIDPMLPCAKLTKEMVVNHLDKIARTISGDRANRTRNHLLEAWRWGIGHLGLPGNNPFAGIEDYSTDKGKHLLVPAIEDFWKLIRACDFPAQVLLRTYYYTAARADELVRFFWQDVNFADDLVKLSTRKGRTGKWRSLWLRVPKDLVTDLKKLKLLSGFSEPSDRVFCDQMDGGPIKDYDHWMKRMCKAAGVSYFGFKGIRHLVAVELYRAGHPGAEIQRRLRHKAPTTTERYLRSLGLEIGSSEVIDTLGNLEKGDFRGDMKKGSATC